MKWTAVPTTSELRPFSFHNNRADGLPTVCSFILNGLYSLISLFSSSESSFAPCSASEMEMTSHAECT